MVNVGTNRARRDWERPVPEMTMSKLALSMDSMAKDVTLLVEERI